MKRIRTKIRPIVSFALKLAVASLLIIATGVGVGPAEAQTDVQTSFLYRLSNFSGPVPLNWATISMDEARDEIYVTDSQTGIVRIFNDQGMEVYHFGDDWGLGLVLATAVRNDGYILVLTRKGPRPSIGICNFRGEYLSELALQDVPADFSGFSPTDMKYRNGRIYLLDNNALQLVVTDSNGFFLNGYELGAMLEIEPQKRITTQIGGFSVDQAGNIYFTLPVIFSAYRLSTDGKLASFGRAGSAPGRFNNMGGIVADDRGYIYVADRLKSAVLIFDRDFRFLHEFGYRGRKPYNLIAPNDLGLDTKGRLYVSQLASIGVSVFNILYK